MTKVHAVSNGIHAGVSHHSGCGVLVCFPWLWEVTVSKSELERNELIQLPLLYHMPWLGEVRAELQGRNLEAGTEAETMGKCSLLAVPHGVLKCRGSPAACFPLIVLWVSVRIFYWSHENLVDPGSRLHEELPKYQCFAHPCLPGTEPLPRLWYYSHSLMF